MKTVLICALLSLWITQLPLDAPAQPSLHYLGPLDTTVDPSAYSSSVGEFIIGNRSAVAGYASSSHFDGFPTYPSYAVQRFCPDLTEIPCESGWRIDAVHFVFANVAPEPTPITLRFDVAEGYPYSAPPEYAGLVTPWTDGVEPLLPSMVVPGAGYYELVVPASSWPCMYLDFWYGISQTTSIWDSSSSDQFRYAVNEAVDWACPTMRSYTISSWVFFDLWDLPGDVIMWVDASCCGTPVAVETDSWGGVKALFR